MNIKCNKWIVNLIDECPRHAMYSAVSSMLSSDTLTPFSIILAPSNKS